jgi:hypothetical protein
MCAIMMLIGVTEIRLSKRDRGMGLLGLVIGTVGLIAYLAAADDPVSNPAATPVLHESETPGPTVSPARSE